VDLSNRIVTVITRDPRRLSPEVQRMKANGAEIWSNVMIRASYEGIKKQRPDAPFKNMRDMFGRHKGETVFVCGSGPSMKVCPGALPGPTFAINRAVKQVKADYWCFSDMKAIRDSGEHMNAKTATWAFPSAMHVFLKDVPGYLIEAVGNPSDYKIKEQRPLYFSGATFSWVLHWAVTSGAKRVITVGCEFSMDGYFDGTPILPFSGQLNNRIVSETARLRVDDMFGEDRGHWFDPNVELLDASGGYLPIPKTKLEDWL
jgi:hypothetical protein